jgi:hypothetical protein
MLGMFGFSLARDILLLGDVQRPPLENQFRIVLIHQPDQQAAGQTSRGTHGSPPSTATDYDNTIYYSVP